MGSTPKVILGEGSFEIDFMASGFQGTAFWNCLKINRLFSDIVMFITGSIPRN